MGGGGGYNGGYGGDSSDNIRAGGGGSYVNTDYVVAGAAVKKKNGTTTNPGNGYLNYQFSTVGPVSVSKDFTFSTSQAQLLLKTGEYALYWQGDGNLVLRHSGKAIWATGTNGQGTHLIFQGDGNLVLRSSGTAIWSTGTADAQKSGHGGRLLTLFPNGNLTITNDQGKVIWQTNTGQ